jgi:hypothetical protein
MVPLQHTRQRRKQLGVVACINMNIVVIMAYDDDDDNYYYYIAPIYLIYCDYDDEDEDAILLLLFIYFIMTMMMMMIMMMHSYESSCDYGYYYSRKAVRGPALGLHSYDYRGSRAIRKAIFESRLSFLAKYIQTMLKFCLNYY